MVQITRRPGASARAPAVTADVRVPLVDLAAEYQTLAGELEPAVQGVLASGRYVLGPVVARFEQAMARYLGVTQAVGVGSGSDALVLALLALGVRPGEEVITTPLTFIATVNAIRQVGARPVLVDVDPGSYLMDPRRTAAAITPQTRALLLVHLFGSCVGLEAFTALSAERGVLLIEDAAQAMGAEWRGRKAGTVGQAGCFSFYPTKNLGAYGEGGLVATNNPAVAERVRALRDHGRRGRDEHLIIGYNSRLDVLQAAILEVKLRHLDGWMAARRALAQRYHQAFTEAGFVGAGGPIQLPPGAVAEHGFHLYVVRTRERDRLRAFLSGQGIATGVYYPVPVHLQACHRELGYREGDFPEAERASRETLALPCFPGLTHGQQDAVIGAIRSFYRAS